MQRLRPSLWELVLLISFCAGVGNGWAALKRQPEGSLSPIAVAITTTLLTLAGWYIWGLFTYLVDHGLFGGHSDYSGTLGVFGRAYLFQLLLAFAFLPPFGWLWWWIALYVTIMAWGIVGPRHLGMRTWQAIVSATLGMLLWLACLAGLQLALAWEAALPGLGVFPT